MLLIFTGSIDGTSDLIVSGFKSNIFRLNFDLWYEYEVAFTPSFWNIKNPAGLEISSKTVTRAFFWKAFQYDLPDFDKMISTEVRYIFREIYNWCAIRGLTRGTPYYFHNQMGKINVLSIAMQYFRIPQTVVTIKHHGVSSLGRDEIIAKSLASEISSERTVLATTLVRVDELHPDYPWYLQHKIDSDWDVTVFQCGQSLFSFKRSRHDLKGLDWRTEQKFDHNVQEWFPFELIESDTSKLLALSNQLKIDFGRYDFMLCSKTNELIFLEYNANGQWVFLDYHNQYGLLNQVVKYLS